MKLFRILGLCLAGLCCLPSEAGELQCRCPFCNQAVVNSQKFYEDDLVIALYTHKPVVPGHCLIIPKRHVERYELLTDEEMAAIGRVTREVHGVVSEVFNTSSYLLLQKNGYEVGQTVPHIHVHYLPRQEGDSSSLTFLARMYWAMIRDPMPAEEMQQMVEATRKAFEDRPLREVAQVCLQ